MEELISVIVPVYKVERYLDKCISSIVNQTYRDLEIILVDDGSPDNCPAMCDAWAEKDSRITVIHQPNGGAGSARNTGMAAVHGGWFAFVDSDDYIAPRMIEAMAVRITEDVDLIECAMAETADEAFPFAEHTDGAVTVMNAEQAMAAHIADTIFRQTPPNKLYRTSAAAGILFPIGTLIDDEFWTYRVIGNARTLIHIPDVLYAYRQHDSSAIHRSFSLARLQVLDARAERAQYIRERFPALTARAEISLWGSCLYSYQMALSCLQGKERAAAHEKVKQILSQIPADQKRFRSLGLNRKLWWLLSKCSLTGTCRLRNLLGIGT